MNILLIVGLTIFLGALAGKLFQRLRIPQIVGYVILGLFLGQSFLNVWHHELIEIFNPLIQLALGVIGFLIGSELKIDLFKNKGKSIYAVLIGESFIAALIVYVAVTLLTGKAYYGLLLGAIAAASAPAATVNVLWEYKTRGPLTSMILAVVALDDAAALIIYGFASAFARSMIVQESASFLGSVLFPLTHIISAVAIGGIGGYLLSRIAKTQEDKERIFSFALGIIILAIAAAYVLKADLILASMVAGVTLANLAPIKSKDIFDSIKRFSPPLYIMFFVLAGAHIDLSLLVQPALTTLIIVYLLSRTVGKMSGAYLGSVIGKAPDVVRRYLGCSLFAQAGVQIGMALSIYHLLSHFGPQANQIGLTIVNVTLATTFVLEIIGPFGVRYAVHQAGEVDRDITEEDIISLYHVADLMDKDTPIIKENATLHQMADAIRESESYHFCVIDKENKLLGLISLGDLRSTLMEDEEGLDELVRAKDIAVPAVEHIEASQPLKEAIDKFRQKEIDFLPVVDNGSQKLVGAMHYRTVLAEINRQLIQRRGII